MPATSKQHVTKDNSTTHNHLLSPKRILSIGTWNVRTAKEDSQLQIIERETERFNCDFIGLAETHRLDTKELTVKGFKFIG